MAKIKIKACGYSMEASGSDKFVAGERAAFFAMVNGNIGKAVAGLYAAGPETLLCADAPSKSRMGRMRELQTGVLDKNGTMICTGDVVHYKGSGLSAHGKVVEHEEYEFAIEDDRPRTKGRLYSMKNEGVYRIESRNK